MYKMNKLMSIGVVISLVLTSCGTTKKSNEKGMENKQPFKIISATYSSGEGEQANVKEIQMLITIDNPEVQLDSVYFRNTKTGLKREISAPNHTFVGNFLIADTQKDYNLHSDPQKEYGNTPPGTTSKIPFKLQKNEAVVSYVFNRERQYYKIAKVVKIAPNSN